MVASQRSSHLHEEVALLDLDRIPLYANGPRIDDETARAQVEFPAVPRAGDEFTLSRVGRLLAGKAILNMTADQTGRQSGALMRAGVADGEELLAASYHEQISPRGAHGVGLTWRKSIRRSQIYTVSGCSLTHGSHASP